jgi:hypothetical protein
MTKSTSNIATINQVTESVVVWKELEKEMKEKILKQAVQMYMVEKLKIRNNKLILPRNTVTNIIKRLGSPPWLNRHTVNHAIKKQSKTNKNNAEHGNHPFNENDTDTIPDDEIPVAFVSVDVSDEPSDLSTRSKGGRPTNEKLEEYKETKRKLKDAVEIAAIHYEAERKKVRINNKHSVPYRSISNCIKNAITSVGLPLSYESQISKRTIINRVVRGNTKGIDGTYSNNSPMKPVEDLLVELCIFLNRMNDSIDKETFLGLANDIIKDMPIEKEVIEF